MELKLPLSQGANCSCAALAKAVLDKAFLGLLTILAHSSVAFLKFPGIEHITVAFFLHQFCLFAHLFHNSWELPAYPDIFQELI